MTDILDWEPLHKRDGRKNLNEFVEFGQNKLKIYEDQGGFNAVSWRHDDGEIKPYTLPFWRYEGKKGLADSKVPLEPEFCDFAKAYIRRRQTLQASTTSASACCALQIIHDVLIELFGKADIVQLDGIALEHIQEKLEHRYPGQSARVKVASPLINIYDFLREKNITPHLPDWSSPWKHPTAKSKGIDKESLEWRKGRCPSLHQMIAIADCFNRAESEADLYWSSIMVMLMFAPGRGGEISKLSIHCLVPRDGVLWVSWYGLKGFEETKKAVPECLEPVVRSAHARLMEIGAPARAAAKYAFNNPSKFMRHSGCSTANDHSEDARLTALQVANALGKKPYSKHWFETIERNEDSGDAWNRIVTTGNWLDKMRKTPEGVTYRKLAEHAHKTYCKDNWPKIRGTDTPIWEALCLTQKHQITTKYSVIPFSWKLPDTNDINVQLGSENSVKSMFSRLEIKDEDGSEIRMTSHQLRVWLNTAAKRNGADDWMLARWSARANISHNKHYDLQTEEELDATELSLQNLETRPSVIDAVKMNIPISKRDVGLDRDGPVIWSYLGMCEHDYAQSPCFKPDKCIGCGEEAYIKGLPDRFERIVEEEMELEKQFNKASHAAGNSEYGADQWVTYYGWKLVHAKVVRIMMEDNAIPDGTVIRIPASYDADPILRSLEAHGYVTSQSETAIATPSDFLKLLEDL